METNLLSQGCDLLNNSAEKIQGYELLRTNNSRTKAALKIANIADFNIDLGKFFEQWLSPLSPLSHPKSRLVTRHLRCEDGGQGVLAMLYHFQIELSDIDRGLYQTLDFRIAQHPSETGPYLLSRALAYVLSFQEGLEFTPGGLNDPEAPALRSMGGQGAFDLWIEIGNPSARKLHKASKAARQVIVYTYKNAELLVEEIKTNDVHRAREIQIYAFDPKFLQALETQLGKNNRWSLLHQQGQLDVDNRGQIISSELRRISFN